MVCDDLPGMSGGVRRYWPATGKAASSRSRGTRIIRSTGGVFAPGDRLRSTGCTTRTVSRGPVKKNASGGFDPISWETALLGVSSSIADIRKSGRRKGGIVFLSEMIDGALKDLAGRWLSAFDGDELVLYEPISYEPLKQAARDVFGTNDIPAYRLDKADFILSFGADFLETWLSPVEYARHYADFRAKTFEEGGGSVFIGPRLSLTAANADRWVRIPPGGESFAAEAILKAILDEDLVSGSNRKVFERTEIRTERPDSGGSVPGVRAGRENDPGTRSTFRQGEEPAGPAGSAFGPSRTADGRGLVLSEHYRRGKLRGLPFQRAFRHGFHGFRGKDDGARGED